MSTPHVPVLLADASVYPVSPEAQIGEPGTITFTRNLARHLESLIDAPVTDVLHRENPWLNKPCAKAWTAEYTIGGLPVIVTAFETTAPLVRGPFTQFAITIDGRPRLFDAPSGRQPLEWHLALAISTDLTG